MEPPNKDQSKTPDLSLTTGRPSADSVPDQAGGLVDPDPTEVLALPTSASRRSDVPTCEAAVGDNDPDDEEDPDGDEDAEEEHDDLLTEAQRGRWHWLTRHLDGRDLRRHLPYAAAVTIAVVSLAVGGVIATQSRADNSVEDTASSQTSDTDDYSWPTEDWPALTAEFPTDLLTPSDIPIPSDPFPTDPFPVDTGTDISEPFPEVVEPFPTVALPTNDPFVPVDTIEPTPTDPWTTTPDPTSPTAAPPTSISVGANGNFDVRIPPITIQPRPDPVTTTTTVTVTVTPTTTPSRQPNTTTPPTTTTRPTRPQCTTTAPTTTRTRPSPSTTTTASPSTTPNTTSATTPSSPSSTPAPTRSCR